MKFSNNIPKRITQYLNDIEKCNDRTHKNPKQARYCMFCRKPV